LYSITNHYLNFLFFKSCFQTWKQKPKTTNIVDTSKSPHCCAVINKLCCPLQTNQSIHKPRHFQSRVRTRKGCKFSTIEAQVTHNFRLKFDHDILKRRYRSLRKAWCKAWMQHRFHPRQAERLEQLPTPHPLLQSILSWLKHALLPSSSHHRKVKERR